MRVAVALTAATTVLGLTLLVPTNGSVVRVLADDAALGTRTGLARSEALGLAEDVRLFVLGRDSSSISERYFSEREISHLEDVRSVLRLRWLAVAAALTLAVLLAAARRLGRWRDCAAGLAWGGGVLLGTLVLLLFVGLVDFDTLFTAFHGLFFAAGTWTFDDSDLIIRLFPLRFWVVEGVLWAAVTALGAAVLAFVGLRNGRRRSSEGR